MTELVETTPATEEEIAQYAAECANANAERCDACFVGPAIAGCASFLCRRDIGKLLASLSALREERDALKTSLDKAMRDLAAARQEAAVLARSLGRTSG